ncbi:MAG: sigma-70 family RNA polymerase sigma factor [Chitinophagaceae bacterium]|nr:MAG: sigma-70 family RNA polymerase sigma factor [Chitinophagaceae bacterium]
MIEPSIAPAGYVSDEELVQRVRNGELLLFELLIRRYNGLLYKVARSYGFGHEDAEDLMQETHLAAYTNLKGFRGAASYRTWLTKIHLNNCYQKRRIQELRAGITGSTADEEIADGGNEVARRELGRVLEQSLQALPLAYRSVFVLREVEGFSVAEVAGLLGITPVNVKVRSNRAKAMLQKGLEQRYGKAELYEFHLKYCDKIVHYVFERIHSYTNNAGE